MIPHVSFVWSQRKYRRVNDQSKRSNWRCRHWPSSSTPPRMDDSQGHVGAVAQSRSRAQPGTNTTVRSPETTDRSIVEIWRYRTVARLPKSNVLGRMEKLWWDFTCKDKISMTPCHVFALQRSFRRLSATTRLSTRIESIDVVQKRDLDPSRCMAFWYLESARHHDQSAWRYSLAARHFFAIFSLRCGIEQ